MTDTQTTNSETFEFQTQARQLLDLMIHSVYSNKEIFLRELISNSSDALDKLRFEALTNADLAPLTEDQRIDVSTDPHARTLTILDNGIGMTRDEVKQYLGTIARSGTREFTEALKSDEAKSKNAADLIGQFGVGFYSAFMAADKITLTTRKAGTDEAVLWESTGDGTYQIQDGERAQPGTTVTLHLKPADHENTLDDFTSPYVLRRVIKRYSDYVSYPIYLTTPPKEESEETAEPEIVNSRQAIWSKNEKDITDEEHKEFYQHLSHDWTAPLEHIHLKAEGTNEFRALLYIPAKAPVNLYHRDRQSGVHLYIRRVFIMNDTQQLLPDFLRFISGVVDSEDLPLNVSRELLQNDRRIATIRKALVKKILDSLKNMRKNQPEKFASFWAEFGKVLKEGLLHDDGHRAALLEVCQFTTTRDGNEKTTLADYVGQMAEGQEDIYFLSGPNRETVAGSPHLEAFKKRNFEVLLLSDPADEFWPNYMHEFEGKQLRDIGSGEVKLGSEEEQKETEAALEEQSKSHEGLLEKLQSVLENKVTKVRLSQRLTDSPVVLVNEEGSMTPQMEAMMKAMGQPVPPAKRILELNADHPMLKKLQSLYDANAEDTQINDYADLLYGQSILANGGQLDDPAEFSKKLSAVLSR